MHLAVDRLNYGLPSRCERINRPQEISWHQRPGKENRNAVNSALRKTLKITGIVLGSLVVIVLVVLAIFDWNTLKHPLERIAAAHSFFDSDSSDSQNSSVP